MSRLHLAVSLALLAACNDSDEPVAAGDTRGTDVPNAGDVPIPPPDIPPLDVPDVTCEPACTDGVCSPDGCGGACPACGDLPAAYGTSCRLDGDPEPPGAVMLEPAFDKIVFDYPVHINTLPDGTLLIVEKKGVVKTMPDDPTASGADVGLFMDISQRVDSTKPEGGLLSLVLHPDYATNRYVFVNYTGTVDSKFTTLVSRFIVGADGMVDATSELRLLSVRQPYTNHNGGQLGFGPDGYLYVGMGDGGSGGDPDNRAQDLGQLLGKFLRIDVDNPSGGKNYGVPEDNPFVGVDGAMPEIWAYGLRNPWRFAFDPLTGLLWTADVGQKKWEEIDIIERGKNYGWNIMEGSACYKPEVDCNPEGLTLPVAEYPHNDGHASVTGGFVYRGKELPGFVGSYVYADYVLGTMYAVRFGGDGEAVVTDLGETEKKVTTFGLTKDGELLLAHVSPFNTSSGEIYRVVAAGDPVTPRAAFPRRLSETGCFKNLETLEPADGLLEYTVNTPLWHDGARSVRHLALPTGGKLSPTDGAWTLPVGTRTVKTFVYDTPEGPLKVETRFVIQGEAGVRVFGYRWNDEGTDAELLDSGAVRHFQLGAEARAWHFPSRADCLTCHNEASGRFLGWSTAQLDREATLGSVTGNQLELWEKLGILAAAPQRGLVFPDPADTSVPVETRARAVMDVNCATCHRPGGLGQVEHDLRFATPLDETGVCDTEPSKEFFGVPNERLLAPGNPEASNLLLRMKTLGDLRMPSLGSHVVDEQAVGLITEWIQGLSSCEAP